MKLFSLFALFLFLSMIFISFSNFVDADGKVDVSVRVVENVEEKNVSVGENEVNRSLTKESITGLIALKLSETNTTTILVSVVVFIILLIIYIVIKKRKSKKR